MSVEKDLLIMSGARLYSLGVDLEGAREEVRRLVNAGTPYTSPEMEQAVKNFREIECQWKNLEAEHLKLRDEAKTH
ncbi:MAG: hypothetical protein RR949_04370 [Oscillospiraceae bacterium]